MQVIQLFTRLSKHADSDKNRIPHQLPDSLEGLQNVLFRQCDCSSASVDLGISIT